LFCSAVHDAYSVYGPAATGLFIEVVGVELDEALPLFRHFVFHEDRVHRALRLTQAAVDTLGRIDEELVVVVGSMDAVHRADRDAGLVFHADTRLGNHVGHLVKNLSLWKLKAQYIASRRRVR
jgi:hypothetical protein